MNDIDLTQLYDDTKSLNEGALTIPGYSMDGWYGRIFRGCGYFDPDKPIRKFTKKELDELLYKEPTKIQVEGINLTYAGLIPTMQRSMLSKDVDALQPHIRAFVERAVTFATCPDCDGTRLNEAARSSKIGKVSIADACAMQISDLATWVGGLAAPSVAPLLVALGGTLDSFVEIGLGYLSLDRPAGTLSGGEAQRTKMIRHLGSSLTDVTYVFDEPTIGLHAHDVERMNELLLRLRDKGNTVLVVEHDPEAIAIADHVVDMGPGAGPHGGAVVFEGPSRACAGSGTSPVATSTTAPPEGERANARRLDPDPGRATHNLKDVAVDVPLGCSSRHRRRRLGQELADPRLVSRTDPWSRSTSPRSAGRAAAIRRPTPGLLDPIRKAFAKANGVKPALFSANSEGACPNCNGLGMIYTTSAFMAEVVSICEVCEGRRFTDDVLKYRLRGRNIVEVLAMPVEEAREFFTEKPDCPRPRCSSGLADVGLGYLGLGQQLDDAVRRRAAAAEARIEMSEQERRLCARRADDGAPHAGCRAPARPARPARRLGAGP